MRKPQFYPEAASSLRDRRRQTKPTKVQGKIFYAIKNKREKI